MGAVWAWCSAAVGSQYETTQRTELVRKLVPQLGHDFMQIQKRDKAHADFQKLGRVREALDDLRTQLQAYDENSHIRSVSVVLPYTIYDTHDDTQACSLSATTTAAE